MHRGRKICKYQKGSKDGGYDTSFMVKREKYAKITEVIQRRTKRELNKRNTFAYYKCEYTFDIAPVENLK